MAPFEAKSSIQIQNLITVVSLNILFVCKTVNPNVILSNFGQNCDFLSLHNHTWSLFEYLPVNHNLKDKI